MDLLAWRDDVEYFAKELPKRHKNLFLSFPKENFEREISRLKSDLPQLSDKEVVFRLQQISAKAGDLHTYVIRRIGAVFPIVVGQFGEDFFVTAVAQKELQYLLGTKLISIDDVNFVEVSQTALTLISAENKFALKALLPRVITDAEAIHFLGITLMEGTAKFTFEKKGELITWNARAETNIPKTAWHFAYDKPPLSMSRPEEFYWQHVIPEARALYINYSRCEERKDLPFSQFVNDIAVILDQQPVDRVIIDLRTNSGGNEAIIRPLIQALKQRKVSIFVLIGRRTFSSAFGNALSIKTQLKGVLLGEPTGQKPNAFGEVEFFTLKNSQLKIQYSTKWWARLKSDDTDALYPDISIEVGIEQYKNGEDTVLETALRLN